MITKTRKAIAASGATTENEPIIKSDGASSDVMQWLSNDESSNVTISEDDSNNLDLVVSAGNVLMPNGGQLQITDSSVGTDPAVDDSAFIKLTNSDIGTVSEVWGINFSSYDGSTDRMGAFVQAYGDFATNWNTSLIFGTRGVAGDVTERFRIDSAGNAGLGGTPPGTSGIKLNIHQASSGANYQHFTNTTTGVTDADGFLIGIDANEKAIIWNSEATDMLLATSGSTRLTISSAGLATFNADATLKSAAGAQTTSTLNFLSTNYGSYGSTYSVDSKITSSNTDSGNAYGSELKFYTNDTANALTERMSIAQDGLTIVKNPSWPLKNELTNSGFDCWSNSTLENVTGTNLATAATWTDYGSRLNTFTASGADITSAIESGGGTSYPRSNAALGLTIGKLYKIVATLTLNSGVAPTLRLGAAGDVTSVDFPTKTLVAGANTVVFEYQTASSDHLWMFATGDTNYSCTFVVTEVTPGCVGANALACDGWFKSGVAAAKCWRQHNDGGTYTKDGSFYSAKIENTSDDGNQRDVMSWPNPGFRALAEWYQRFAGRTVTFGAWVKTSNANEFNLMISDDVSASSESSHHTGGGAWEWLEVTHAVNAAPAIFKVRVMSEGDVATATAYVSQPMLVFGSAIGSGNYSRPSGEIVNFENASKLLNNWNATDSGGRQDTMNLEAESNGVVPKGAKAVYLSALVRDSNSSGGGAVRVYFGQNSTSKYDLQIWLDEVYDNEYRAGSGRVNCDSSGDIYYDIDSTGSDTFEASLRVTAVELR